MSAPNVGRALAEQALIGGASVLGVQKYATSLLACVACSDLNTQFTDVSGYAAHIMNDFNHTTAFANAGYLTTAASLGSCQIPAEKFSWDMSAESFWISGVMNRVTPSSTSDIVLSVNCDVTAGYTGFYLSHRQTIGKLRIIPKLNGNSVSPTPADSTAVFSAGTAADYHFMVAYDAPTGTFMLFCNGVISDVYAGVMTVGNIATGQLSKGVKFGGLVGSGNAIVAAQFKNIQIYKRTGCLPNNINYIARKLFKNQDTPLRDIDIVYPSMRIVASVLGQSNEAGPGGGSSNYVSKNIGDGFPGYDYMYTTGNGSYGGFGGYNTWWPALQNALGNRKISMNFYNTAHGSTSISDVWVGKVLTYTVNMLGCPGSYIISVSNGFLYKLTGLAMSSTVVLAADPGLAAPTVATGASCSISGTVLTVGGAITGTWVQGQTVTGSGVSANTIILSQASGTTGGAGTYNINNSQTVGTEAMNGVVTFVQQSSVQTFEVNGYIYSPTDGTNRFDPNGLMALALSAVNVTGYDRKLIFISIGQGDIATGTTRAQYSQAIQNACAYFTASNVYVGVGMTFSSSTNSSYITTNLLPGRSDALTALASNSYVFAGADLATYDLNPTNEPLAHAQPINMMTYSALQNNGTTGTGVWVHANAVKMAQAATLWNTAMLDAGM